MTVRGHNSRVEVAGTVYQTSENEIVIRRDHESSGKKLLEHEPVTFIGVRIRGQWKVKSISEDGGTITLESFVVSANELALGMHEGMNLSPTMRTRHNEIFPHVSGSSTPHVNTTRQLPEPDAPRRPDGSKRGPEGGSEEAGDSSKRQKHNTEDSDSV